MRRLLLLICLAASTMTGTAASAADSPTLQAMLDEAIASGAERLIIPPGQYRLVPSDRVHLVLQDARDLEIIADGVEIICTETTRAINFINCHNVTLRGLTIDYDPLPWTQGRIVAISEDHRTHTIKLQEGYPLADKVRPAKYEIFAAATRQLRTTTYFGIRAESFGPRRLQVVKPPHYRPEHAVEQVGDLITIATNDAPGGTMPHAIWLNECRQVSLIDVTLYSANTFGFFETHCSNSRYQGCRVDRRPLDDDLVERESPRLRSLNADAFHSKHAMVGPSYIDCLARYMGDDGIAINGHYHLITATDGNQVQVIGKLGDAPELQVGDPVELLHFSGRRPPDATITALTTEAGELTDAERAFIADQPLNDRLRRLLLGSDVRTTITLDRQVDLPMGSLIAAANRLGNGFTIRDCRIGPIRSRGILVKASHGTISNNTLTGCWGEAIKLAPEYWWLEAGSSKDVTIADNTILECRDTAIAVYAKGGDNELAPPGAHRDIRITDNTILRSANPAIAVTSTTQLTLQGNVVRQPDNSLIVPWKRQEFGRQEEPDRDIYLYHVD